MGELRDSKWVYVGNVGSGFDQRQLVELTAYFGSLKGECPFGQADIGRPVKSLFIVSVLTPEIVKDISPLIEYVRLHQGSPASGFVGGVSPIRRKRTVISTLIASAAHQRRPYSN